MCASVSCSVSVLHVRLFGEQQLFEVRFSRGVAAPLEPLPVTLHEGQRHLLPALGVTAGVRREVVLHCFRGVGRQAEAVLKCNPLRVCLRDLESRVAGQSGPTQTGHSLHKLPSRLWPSSLVQPWVALVLCGFVSPEQGQCGPTLFVEQTRRGQFKLTDAGFVTFREKRAVFWASVRSFGFAAWYLFSPCFFWSYFINSR